MHLTPATTPASILLAKLAPGFDAFSFLKTYAAIQALSRIIEMKGWIFPHAAFKVNARNISEEFDVTWPLAFLQSENFQSEFNKIYSTVQPLTLKDFLREYLPDFVTQIDRTFDVLDSQLGVNIETKCLLLLLAKKEWLRGAGEEYPVEAYEHRVRKKLNSDDWSKLVYSVNCYACSYKSKVLKAANDAHKVFQKYHLPSEYQVALYGQIRENLVESWEGRDTIWSKHISDGAQYMRSRMGGDPRIDFLGMDEAINAAAKSIGKIEKPTDFLEAVLVNGSNDDSKIENDFVYSKFVDRLSPEDSVLIINPSPDFLCQYPKKFLKQTLFCVCNQPVAWVLENEFDSSFISFSEFLEFCNNDMLNRQTLVTYSKTLIFSREIPKKMLQQLLQAASESTSEEDGFLYALLPSDGITSESGIAANDLAAGFFIQKLDLLPKNSFCSFPKKKVFVQAAFGSVDSIEVTDYEFFKGSDNSLYLRKVFETPTHLNPELLYAPRSIYTLYREQFQNAPTEYRKHPHSYAFTKEIFFWYTVSNSPRTFGQKVEAYTCYFPTEQQRKRRLLLRGKKIKGAYASTSKLNTLEEFEDWCENILPYKPRIHQGVLAAFKKDDSSLRIGHAALKTLWYLQLDLKGQETNPLADLEKELFSSIVGELCFNAGVDQYEEAMEIFCVDKTQEEQSLLWDIIRRVLNYAVKNGYLGNNPVENIAQTFREKSDSSTAAVRSALVKKTFHHEEEKKLLAFLFEKIQKESQYLCVLIRFFTGLEPNIISALTWGDIHRISETDIYQFWIYQQFKNNGDTPIPLEYDEDYRRIPITETLCSELRKRKTDIETRLGIPQKEIEKLQIIASDKQLRGESEKNITPRKINELSKKAVEAIGIQEIVVDLPDDENGTKETNLAKYRGDIFRTNFHYRANVQCGFTDSESRYILGLRQKTPFGKNYCDYLNTFSQLGMYYKLRRWDIALRSSAPAIPRVQNVEVSQPLAITNSRSRANAILAIPLGEHAEEITVHFHCAHGLSVNADVFRVDGTTLHEEE